MSTVNPYYNNNHYQLVEFMKRDNIRCGNNYIFVKHQLYRVELRYSLCVGVHNASLPKEIIVKIPMELLSNEDKENANNDICNVKRYSRNPDTSLDVEKLTDDDVIFGWLFNNYYDLPNLIYFENNAPQSNYNDSIYCLGKNEYIRRKEEQKRKWAEEKRIKEQNKIEEEERRLHLSLAVTDCPVCYECTAKTGRFKCEHSICASCYVKLKSKNCALCRSC